MPRALVVADDLTGATDTGHAFAARGYRTTVQVDRSGRPPRSTVRAVDVDSRYADPDVAAGRVRAAVDAGSDALVYKKVDSTLRGNVASEIDAAMDASGAPLAVVAPAAPAVGRTTACGHHLVDGRPLAETEYADDPKGAETGHLPTLLGGAGRPVVHVGVGTVAAGAEAVERAFADTPRGALAACDATHDQHLESIADAAGALDPPPVYAGSSGLAAHVDLPGEPDGDPDFDGRKSGEDGGALGIVGSVSATTLDQLDALPAGWVIALDPETVARDPERAGRAAAEHAHERLTTGEHAVVTAAPDREAVERTLAAGERAGHDADAVRARVANALGAAANAVMHESDAGPAGLFVTGGDVARAVFDALGATALSLSGEAVESGVPVGRIDDGPAAGTPVVTKAGGFGGRETAVNCLRHLAGDNGRNRR